MDDSGCGADCRAGARDREGAVMLTSLAGVLTGLWLILESQHSTSVTLTLLFGIIVAVLCLVDLVRGAGPVLLRR